MDQGEGSCSALPHWETVRLGGKPLSASESCPSPHPLLRREEGGTLFLAAASLAYWIVVLRLDSETSLGQQVALGLMTWVFLGLALRFSPPAERIQVLTMVGVASGFEVFSSLLVGFYRYRLENVPLYVPPGHGLFFLMALRTSELPWIVKRPRLVVGGVAAGSVALTVRGAVALPTPDLFGFAAWLVFLWFLLAGRYRRFYAVSFVMTMALEFYGTSLGLWRWASVAPIVALPAANPPCGIGAGYCVMDGIARRLSPRAGRVYASVARMAASRRSSLGEIAASSSGLMGEGTSGTATRRGAAFSRS